MYHCIVRLNGNLVESCGVQFIDDPKFFQKNKQNIQVTENECLEISIALENRDVVEYDKKTNAFTIVNREVK
jgi:hypothetical protein